MGIEVKINKFSDSVVWDAYVNAHPEANLYHLSVWEKVIKKVYGHNAYYLIASHSHKKSTQSLKLQAGTPSDESRTQKDSNSRDLAAKSYEMNWDRVTGVLPLIHIKHFLFGSNLVSMPYFDMGGILTNDEKTENALLMEVIKLGQKLKVTNIDLRHTKPLQFLGPESTLKSQNSQQKARKSNVPALSYEVSNMSCVIKTHTHKYRMLLELPESAEKLMKSFKSKLRSQIKKPMKEGLTTKIGGIELIDDFYKVFSINMRDLGSPVHSKKLIKSVLVEFSQKAKIVLVCKKDQVLAGALVIGFRNILENPWASSLREYSRLSPNMLLYWSMLEYACENRYSFFDFGRSTANEGTYKFKKQWGAKPETLYWNTVSIGENTLEDHNAENSKFDKAILLWKKLPVPLTIIFGPRIRKYISL